jgi:cell fate regulator YaaT (PSP1 superfamily)
VRDEIDPFEGGDDTAKIVGVELQPIGHVSNYAPNDLPLMRGDRVLVETDAGLRLGTVVFEPHEADRSIDVASLPAVIRIATDEDFHAEENLLQHEARAKRLCVEKIRERRVPMKLINAEYSFDGRRATFYFTAGDRVDFRNLVRDLSLALNVRVEMKQIRAREETKVTGAVGPCGRELCCSSWLRDFDAVTVKMAREQGLALNPSRLAGMCGRLKCCLKYEYATYVELKRNLPGLGKQVQSVKGDGKVIRHNILKQTVTVLLEGEGGMVEATLEDLVDTRPH